MTAHRALRAMGYLLVIVGGGCSTGSTNSQLDGLSGSGGGVGISAKQSDGAWSGPDAEDSGTPTQGHRMALDAKQVRQAGRSTLATTQARRRS